MRFSGVHFVAQDKTAHVQLRSVAVRSAAPTSVTMSAAIAVQSVPNREFVTQYARMVACYHRCSINMTQAAVGWMRYAATRSHSDAGHQRGCLSKKLAAHRLTRINARHAAVRHFPRHIIGASYGLSDALCGRDQSRASRSATLARTADHTAVQSGRYARPLDQSTHIKQARGN